MINRVGAEKEQCPATADAGAAEETIAFVLFQIDATYKEKRGGEVRDADFAEPAKSAEFVDAEESDTHDKNDDTEFVEPVCAEGFFDRRNRLHALLKSRLGCRRAIGCDWRGRGDARGHAGRDLRQCARRGRGNARRRRLARRASAARVRWAPAGFALACLQERLAREPV